MGISGRNRNIGPGVGVSVSTGVLAAAKENLSFHKTGTFHNESIRPGCRKTTCESGMICAGFVQLSNIKRHLLLEANRENDGRVTNILVCIILCYVFFFFLLFNALYCRNT